MSPELELFLIWYLPGLIALGAIALISGGEWEDPFVAILSIICGAAIFGPLWIIIALWAVVEKRGENRPEPDKCPICGWHEGLGPLRTIVMKALRK